MISAPQTTANQLLDKLNEICDISDVTPLEFARINKEAKDLVKVDPVAGYTVLGAIACVKFDIPTMKSHHLNAIKLAPTDYFAINNYISSLGRTWLISEQFDILQNQFKAGISPEGALLKTVYNRAVLGSYSEVTEYGNKYLTCFKSDEEHTDIENLLNAANLIKSSNLDEEEVKQYAEILNGILEKSHMPVGYVTHILTPENELVRNVAVDAPRSIITELNEELFELLTEKSFTHYFLSKFSGRFVNVG